MPGARGVSEREDKNGICLKNGAFYYHDGLTKRIGDSEADWDGLPPIGGERADGHLIGGYHRDRTVTVALFHSLSDGRGLLFFAEELLCAYAACASGEAYAPDTTQKMRLPAQIRWCLR